MPDFHYDIGAMVSARGRDWIVLPESTDDFLLLKPLGGGDLEVTGLYVGDGGEAVSSAQFALPNPQHFADHSSARLLRDAAQLAIRSGAGPFRSLARLGFEPRPYQLVPLLMALRLDPVRLLIADDVGIGKTVEAGLIARELLDRGEIRRIAVLCPPHLAGQWQTELRSKFGLEATLVLPTTVRRLERDAWGGKSIFESHPHVIVSTDFIKSDRWRDEFLSKAPEFVIVDEAHTCAEGGDGQGSKRHQRYRLLEGLAKDPERHLVLVTATPHSGKEDPFRSLLALLNPEFRGMPLDLSGAENERARIQLARHLVQRKRADIRAYLGEDTPFPERLEAEQTYSLNPQYAAAFEELLAYARESVQARAGELVQRQRIRWWAALGLLRAMASSPAAAAETLRNRASFADERDGEVIEELGRELVLDPSDDSAESLDATPGAQLEEGQQGEAQSRESARLLAFAERITALEGPQDHKLTRLMGLVKDSLEAGHAPIVFCRFIATADYVAKALSQKLSGVEVRSVTGRLSPDAREGVILELTDHPRRVLVATDCLSEGINLQEGFSAVIHYDLPWNPTRLEQREGRVDRYGQPKAQVRVITYYGIDNGIDGIVLDVLIRKHREIRKTLGVAVPAPDEGEDVLSAVLNGVLLRGGHGGGGEQPSLFELSKAPQQNLFDFGSEDDGRAGLMLRWEDAAQKESRSRSRFAQNSIRVEEVKGELEAVRRALGDSSEVQRFVLEVFKRNQLTVGERGGVYTLEPPRMGALRDLFGGVRRITFKDGVEGVPTLRRNSPLVEGLASFVLGQALEDTEGAMAQRAGVVRTAGVTLQTTLLLLRHRYHLSGRRKGLSWQTLAEELDAVAFRGSPSSPQWLEDAEIEALYGLTPSGNLPKEVKEARLRSVLENFEALRPALDTRRQTRAEALLEAHTRVRSAAKGSPVAVQSGLDAPLPSDVLGVYIFVPQPRGVA